VQEATIEDGGFYSTVRFPTTVAASGVVDAVQETYPTAELVSRQQVTRSDETRDRISRALTEDLTDRQRAALEAAVYSGFFEWPRDASGEDVARSLDIAPPTFHQHLRKAQRKVFESVFLDTDVDQWVGQRST
jgi:predicted DNA binding protein